MSEKAFWGWLRTKVGSRWHAVRIENLVDRGTPDVNFKIKDGAEGWLELKQLDDWPKRLDTIVSMKRYTQEQRLWLLTRAEAGGKAGLLLKVKNDILLFGPYAAYHSVGNVPRDTLFIHARYSWGTVPFTVDSFIKALNDPFTFHLTAG